MSATTEHAAMAYTQLAELLKAGMPLPEALRTLASETSAHRLKRALDRAASKMESGLSAAEAFQEEDPVLGRTLPCIAAATTANGKLPEMLRELSHWTLEQNRIRREVREALTYPLMVMLLSSALFLTVMALDGFGAYSRELLGDWADPEPMDRRAFYKATFMVVAWTGLLLPFAFLASGWLALVWKGAARIRESLALSLPVVRALARPIALMRFCSSAAVLTKAGVPFHEAVAAAGSLCGFRPYEKETEVMAKRLAAGAAPDTVWNAFWLFPGTVQFMVAAGAKQGSVSQAFEELARIYQVEAEGRSRLIALLLPPICLMALGILILSYLAVALMPLYYFFTILSRLA